MLRIFTRWIIPNIFRDKLDVQDVPISEKELRIFLNKSFKGPIKNLKIKPYSIQLSHKSLIAEGTVARVFAYEEKKIEIKIWIVLHLAEIIIDFIDQETGEIRRNKYNLLR